MIDSERALTEVRQADARELPLASIHTEAAIQPRVLELVPLRQQYRETERSKAHIGAMRLALEASPLVQLEPILAADIDGRLVVVDGHHRLEAYRLAKRQTVPARVHPMTRKGAALAACLANLSARAMEEHVEQRREAAWQYLAEVTCRGRVKLSAGESLRTIAGRTGVSKDTVGRMLERMTDVDPAHYKRTEVHPITTFPRWKFVCEHHRKPYRPEEDDDMNDLTTREAVKLAAEIGKLLEDVAPVVQQRMWRMLAREATDMEIRSDMAALGRPENLGF